jgi:membrane protein implicated in regulation of membrane protease activity
LKSLVELNIELAKLEGKQKVTALGKAAGFAGGAAALVFYAIGFGFAAAAAGLNESLPLWLSLLIVAAALLLLAAVLGLLARRSAGELSTPLPSAAIEEAERTLKAVEEHV